MDGNENLEAACAVVSYATRCAVPQAHFLGNDLFHLLFENSLDAILIADDDGKFLDVNQPACDLFGYSYEQMLRMRIGDLMTLEPLGAAERYERYLATGREAGEFQFVRPDNQVCIASYSACRLNSGQHLSILRDLTQQKREQAAAAEELARQARLFDTTLSSIADFAFIFDREGRFLYANRALIKFWRRELSDVLGKNFFDLDYPPALAARLQEQIESVFETGRSLRDETPYVDVTGILGYYEYIFVPVFGTEGGVEAVAGSTRDMTTQHQEKAEKEELNARLRRAMIETHHRVKNNLQLMAAFIDMQRQSGAEMVPMSELVRLGQNIQALGVIHDLLTREAKVDGDTEFISIKRVFEAFLPLLRTTLAERHLLTEIDDIYLLAKQTTSLTLVTNELISNAVKHGKGEVGFTLRAEGSIAVLKVYDDGPGFAIGFDPQTAAHTGLELIENIVRYDLRGETSYQNRAQGGACVIVTFPIQRPHSS